MRPRHDVSAAGDAVSPDSQPGSLAIEDPARRWRLSDDVVVENRHEGRVTLFQRVTLSRLRVTEGVHRFLLGFEPPRRMGDLFPDGVPERLRAQLSLLVEKGFLFDPDAPAQPAVRRRRIAVPYRFCNAPAYGEGRADAVFIGVPRDLAGKADSRNAPELLRRRSHDHAFERFVHDGSPRGWFDANRGRRILSGVRIADAGDVWVAYGESQEAHFERLASVLSEICAHGALPVLLGGDRTVTCAAARHFALCEPVVVIQLSPRLCVAQSRYLHGVDEESIAARLLDDRHAECLIALGDIQRGEIALPPGMQRFDTRTLERSPDAWLPALGRGRRVHVSIDLALAVPGTMRPGDMRDDPSAPPGLSLDALRALLSSIGATQHVVGIDIAGLDTTHPHAEIMAAIGCNLALTALEAAFATQARAA